MKSCLRNEVRRCRPLLGTFVEIAAAGSERRNVSVAIDKAFSRIERIQRLLSAQDPASELSLLNREAAGRSVRVSADTFEVLRRAVRLADESGGAFDCTVAPALAAWGLLPPTLKRKNPGSWRHVLLLKPRRVRFQRRLALDLGGIAKGYAVDAAVAALRARGVDSGIVNAGGDLRVFGRTPAVVHIRHPVRPGQFARLILLRQCALATSSPCFTQRQWHHRLVSHLVNPAEGKPVVGSMSVTVRAPECWLADALTKVVLNAPDRAEWMLAKYRSEAFVLTE
jgi:FAD:protein FMN transferase